MDFSEWSDIAKWANENSRELEPIGCLDSEILETWQGTDSHGNYLMVELVRDVNGYVAQCWDNERSDIRCRVLSYYLTVYRDENNDEDYTNDYFDNVDDAYKKLEWYESQDSSLLATTK